MRFVGGKFRIRHWVAEGLNAVRGDCDTYLEPFVGGGNVFEVVAPTFTTRLCGDAHEDLILLWRAVAAGWQPPTAIPREQWEALRAGPPSALRGFAGYGSSFRGKWFGGYEPAPRRGGTDCVRETRNALLRAAPVFASARIEHRQYHEWQPAPGTLVYCDPPYRNTVGYGAAGDFDHDKFWAVAEQWSRDGAAVVVSEAEAPSGWEVLREQDRSECLRYAPDRPERAMRREALFIHESQAAKAHHQGSKP